MKQIHYAQKERQLKGSVKKLQILLNSPDENYSSQIEKLIQKIRKLVQELLHVISHTELKRILGAVAIYIGISFANQTSAQSFLAPQQNPFYWFGLSRLY